VGLGLGLGLGLEFTFGVRGRDMGMGRVRARFKVTYRECDGLSRDRVWRDLQCLNEVYGGNNKSSGHPRGMLLVSCMLASRAGVGTNGIVECKILSKNAQRTAIFTLTGIRFMLSGLSAGVCQS
jgi:hypothetical protein